MFNILRCSACCRPSRTWIIFNRFSTIFEVFVPHFYLHYTYYIVPESLLNHLNSVCRGMLKLNAKFDTDSLLYSLSHFECNDHTVHILSTVYHLVVSILVSILVSTSLTSIVKSSLFTHAHSTPFSLTASLH